MNGMDFSYHRAVAPMMWVLMAIGTVELVVTHLLLRLFWNPLAANVFSALTLSGLAWLAWTVASFRRLPVRIEADRVIMRAGTLRRMELPLPAIAGLRREWDAQALKAPGVAKLSLLSYPNIVLDLAAPLPGRRPVTAVAHRLDDPAAFTAAMGALGIGHVRPR